jgi:DNA-binding NarL/FixJ family response regulator
MRAAIKRILEKETQFQLVDFSNGADAINYLKATRVDMVITDLYMDKGSGFDLLLFIRGRSMANDIPVWLFRVKPLVTTLFTPSTWELPITF